MLFIFSHLFYVDLYLIGSNMITLLNALFNRLTFSANIFDGRNSERWSKFRETLPQAFLYLCVTTTSLLQHILCLSKLEKSRSQDPHKQSILMPFLKLFVFFYAIHTQLFTS